MGILICTSLKMCNLCARFIGGFVYGSPQKHEHRNSLMHSRLLRKIQNFYLFSITKIRKNVFF